MLKKKPPHKSKLVAFRGDFNPELITQEMLKDLESAQRIEWVASRRAILLAEKIKSAIEHDVATEDGPLYFDKELGMVRSRKKESAG